MSGMLTLFFIDSSLATNAGSQNIVDSTDPPIPRSKNSKVQAASNRFVDLFKQVAREKDEEREKP